ncbi:MAG: PASTA domain-containing protein [Acidobacteriota bacterium]|nr:MAG: PASTA domain-containing protein [Acidobacteriota bacterium]
MRGQQKSGLQFRFVTFGKGVLLAGILLVVFVFSVIIGMRFAVRGKVLEAPTLVGMSLEDARGLFDRLELKLVVDGRRYDSYAPADTIISQSPEPGVGIKAERDVRVVVSLGRRVTAVPDLKGTSVRAGRLLAEQNGFGIGVVTEISGVGEDEMVLDQVPSPASTGTLSDQIDLLVQKQKRMSYVMPDITGLNFNRVLMFLKEHGFEARIFYRSHGDVRRGTVVRQFPEPGYMLREDESINLEVAR